MEPLLLCVEMDPGKMLRLSFLASSLGIGVREVPRDRQGMTLGMLCGMDRPGIGKHAQTAPGEMLVMAFLRVEQMNRLLRGMRESGCTVPLKAVLTPSNRHWTCCQLYRELEQEAKRIKSGKAGM